MSPRNSYIKQRLDSVRLGVDDALEYLFGYAMPPIDRAIDEAAWRADGPNAYCPRCGDSVGEGEVTASGCGGCRDRFVRPGRLVRLGTYEAELQDWILAIKFSRWVEMATHLGCELGRAILDSGEIDPERAVVVPMPMPLSRRVFRGIDHASVIAAGAANALNNAPVIQILRRRNATPQMDLSPSERLRHGGRGLSIRPRLGGWPVQDFHLVLVDDVRTTGASIQAASRLLQSLKPAKLIAAVLAVSDDAARRHRAARSQPQRESGVERV